VSETATHRSTVPAIALRPVEPQADHELLVAVYGSTRELELAPVPWTRAEKDAFIRMQFAAQDQHWREMRPGARFDVILLDGEPAGRIYVDRREDEIRIVDIALLPAQRNRGIGRALICELIEEAHARGVPVTIHVERGNPARRLYERLAFTQISTTSVYDLLECRPTASEPPETKASPA
jgi:ribosomal protein S18 acetylase RimI-like enzyme